MSLASYFLTGLFAISLATWISSHFMPKAHSQTPTAAPAPAVVSAPSQPVAKPSPVAPESKKTTDKPDEHPAAAPVQGSGDLMKTPAELLSGIMEDYKYVPTDKRDPFMPFEAVRSSTNLLGPFFELQKFEVDQLKLVGVIWGTKTPRAMISDPTGKGHIVKLNDRIGRNNGYVARIREGEIIVVESFTAVDGKVSYITKMMKLITQ